MADMLGDGLATLSTIRKAYAGTAVTYYRGALSVGVTATLGHTTHRWSMGAQGTVREVSKDYMIDVADLVLSGSEIVPAAGDRVIEVSGGVTYTHEVMSFGPDPAWRWTDAHRRTWRIHTKEIMRI